MTASAAQISKKGYPADFRVKAIQMRDWEAMSRHPEPLGLVHVLRLDGCPIEKDRQADIDKLMSTSGIAVNQLAHILMRIVHWEAILESSVLDRQGAYSCTANPSEAPICSAADVQKHYVWHRSRRRTAFCSRRP